MNQLGALVGAILAERDRRLGLANANVDTMRRARDKNQAAPLKFA